ncbi:hypothetical protein Tco_1029208 [Tanacetum coccineum]|uniref:Uncharacterized protein n=1 Tax=Tanacetum coccineum TaxID=301880 RepID=A0ABQ5G507_9ASTR
MPTEMELTLEQTQQGVSYEVSVDPREFEGYLKMVVEVPNSSCLTRSIATCSYPIDKHKDFKKGSNTSFKTSATLIPNVFLEVTKDDLMPTIKEGEVIEEFRTRDEDLDIRIDDYPSYCDDDMKIHIDYKMVYKGDNVVGALMNVSIFVGTFSVVTDFAVLEDMDAYRDEGMGDVIVGEPFLRDVGIKAIRFDGMITIYNGNDEVTYQMVISHPRFKNHTNEQCNKIPPLPKVSEVDKMNRISHAYQKLKGFYKGVLNLGPDYLRNAKMEEWLTRWHISVHEME